MRKFEREYLEGLQKAVMNLVRNQVAGIQVFADTAGKRLLTASEVKSICNQTQQYPLRIDELFLKGILELEKK